ncbi:MAG: single-stranded-DNA-specific exonuclease RecJ [Sandaracinus sp.]
MASQAAPPGEEGAAAPALETTPQLRICDPVAAAELGARLGIGATVAQLLLHRGLADDERAKDFLDPKLAALSAPDAMRGRTEAADRLASALARGERITVYGDYDVDGTTSTALLSTVLEALGGNVTALAASRFEGYGLSDAALARVKESRPSLLVTCDCGSTDHPRLEDARRAGIETIVVDHHRVPDEPLPAVAFLNPHQPGCGFAYKGLSSAGLAFSVAAALRKARGSSIDLRPFLDFVALGTVADVMPLDGDNRRLVRAGLARLGAAEARPGIVALRERAGVRPGTRIGGADIGFRLAPRLNAAGRLGDASLTLALLRARSLDEARLVAGQIELLNDERKELQRKITEEAADAARARASEPGGGLVLASEQWHRGVVGIVAARIVELFEAPSIVLAIEGDTAHGSARSIPGFPLFDAIAACRSLLIRFGGHQAAAGVTIQASRIPEFAEAFDAECRRLRAEGLGARPDRAIDVVLDGTRFGIPTASELCLLEPTGHGNREPRFLLDAAKVEDASSVGDGHLKLVLRVGGSRLTAFGWDLAGELSRIGAHVSLIGGLRPDSYRGGEAVELKIERVL